MALRSISDAKNVRYEDGTHDLRNFNARTSESHDTIGTIDDVLVDDRGRARYVCVQHASDKRHTLIPAGSVQSDRGSRSVVIPPMSYGSVPEYRHGSTKVDNDYERRVTSAYDTGIARDRYDERPDYRTRGWGTGSDRASTNKLERLDKLDDYKVADGDSDPRGWKVIGRDKKTLGEVEHLIGDTGSMRVRYLVVKLERGIGKGGNILIPTGHVDLDTKRNRVISRGLDSDCMKNMPAYTGGAVTGDFEQQISTACEKSYEGERRYEHPRYRDENLWNEEKMSVSEEELRVGTRERKAGEVDVEKRVETERIQKPVTVHREEVEVERRPASGNTKAEFGDKEIRVPVTEEEVVVEKRPHVVEEIVVRKRDVEETEMIDETVRKERVDVDVDDDRARTR